MQAMLFDNKTPSNITLYHICIVCHLLLMCRSLYSFDILKENFIFFEVCKCAYSIMNYNCTHVERTVQYIQRRD